MQHTLVTYLVPGSVLYGIKYKEGGPTPLPLRGQYTSAVAAERAIERFLLAQNREQSDS